MDQTSGHTVIIYAQGITVMPNSQPQLERQSGGELGHKNGLPMCTYFKAQSICGKLTQNITLLRIMQCGQWAGCKKSGMHALNRVFCVKATSAYKYILYLFHDRAIIGKTPRSRKGVHEQMCSVC